MAVSLKALEKDIALAEAGMLKKPIKMEVKEQYQPLLGKIVILVPTTKDKEAIKNIGTKLCVTYEELVKIRTLIDMDTPETKQVIALMRAFNGNILQ